MRGRVDLEIGGRHIAVPRWVVGLVVIAVLAVPAIWAVQQFRSSLQSYADETNEADTAKSIAGCKRTNQIRIASFSNSVLDAATREAAAPQYTDEARERILQYAALNWQDAQRIVDATAEFPAANWTGSDPTLLVVEELAESELERPGSPATDCHAAFD